MADQIPIPIDGISDPDLIRVKLLASGKEVHAPLLRVLEADTGPISPVVILSTGQSNTALHPVYAWTPASNLYLWNFDGIVNLANVTGTAFAAMDATSMGFDYSYANELAKANPLAKVYLIKIGIGAQAIAQWMVGAAPATLDMYAACKNNVQAALTLLGLTKINKFLWWQGESDALAGSATYLANFETVIARFRAETWFPASTPVTIMAFSPFYGGLVTPFNGTMATVAAVEPDIRKFVYPALPIAFFDAPSAYLHATAAGYEQIGKLAYFAGRANDQSIAVDPATGAIGIGQVPNPLYRLAITYSSNADTAALITNASAGASASASIGLLTTGGAFLHSAKSTAGGATASTFWTGTGNYQLIGGGGIRVMPSTVDKGGVSAAGDWDFSGYPAMNGVKFPATQVPSADANTLDDYEEGTFTPAFSATGATFSHSVQQGVYTKVGRLVTFQVNILLNTSGNTLTANALTITGLPFTPGTGGMFIVRWSNTTTAFIGIIARAAAASTSLILETWTAATTSNGGTAGLANTVLHATNGSALNITGQYYV